MAASFLPPVMLMLLHSEDVPVVVNMCRVDVIYELRGERGAVIGSVVALGDGTLKVRETPHQIVMQVADVIASYMGREG